MPHVSHAFLFKFLWDFQRLQHRNLLRLRCNLHNLIFQPKLHRRRSTRSLQEKRQRSKSESSRHQKEEENRRAFTYTGLDRAIAENYLAQQEKSQSTSISENLGSKCNDVQM